MIQLLKNAGINPKYIMLLAMGIAGACAGLGGAERVLGGASQYTYTELIMGDYGFTGLAVALEKNNPFGILVGWQYFMRHLKLGDKCCSKDTKD